VSVDFGQSWSIVVDLRVFIEFFLFFWGGTNPQIVYFPWVLGIVINNRQRLSFQVSKFPKYCAARTDPQVRTGQVSHKLAGRIRALPIVNTPSPFLFLFPFLSPGRVSFFSNGLPSSSSVDRWGVEE
jgi:hypothetical protein